MKKQIIVFVSLLLISLSLIACKNAADDNSSEQLYYIEAGEIDSSTVQIVGVKYGISNTSDLSSLSFNEVKKLREEVRSGSYKIYDFASTSDVTRKECYDFLISHGRTPRESNEIIDELNRRGNKILIYTLRAYTNHAAYVYAEKQ